MLVVYHIGVRQLTFKLFPALKSSSLLEDMNSRGIKFVDCYGVDNALVIVLFLPLLIMVSHRMKVLAICSVKIHNNCFLEAGSSGRSYLFGLFH